MGEAKKLRRMNGFLKESLKKVRKREEERLCGRMGASLRGSGLRIRSVGRGYWNWLMANRLRVNGKMGLITKKR